MTHAVGETFIVGRDVARALSYSNTRKALLDHAEVEDRTDGVTIRDSIGRTFEALMQRLRGRPEGEAIHLTEE